MHVTLAAFAACVAFLVPRASADAACPCSNPAWCKPITAPPRKEVFAFEPHYTAGDTSYEKWDWTQVTTVGTYTKPIPSALVCFAHQHNARVVYATSFPQAQLKNQTAVSTWIKETIQLVQDGFADGINLDIEGDTADSSLLTTFTKQLATQLRAAIPGSQISFDSSIYPVGQQGYDWHGIGEAVDFLFIMAYDMCWGTHWGESNSPLPRIQTGVQSYLSKVGLPASKLVLGLPWYGYNFPCTSLQSNVSKPCAVETPFGGGAWQIAFSGILNLLHDNVIDKVYYDSTSGASYFNYQKGSQWHQVWYDDERSLAGKYKFAAEQNLRGVGMWHANCLNYTSGERVQSMWETLKNFTAQTMRE